jgi:hypothetical protein
MAFLYITEYSNWVTSPNGDIRSGKEPAITTQRIAIGGETKSAAFNAATRFIRAATDSTACCVLFGAAPTVSASTGSRLAANAEAFFGVNASDVVSVIAQS